MARTSDDASRDPRSARDGTAPRAGVARRSIKAGELDSATRRLTVAGLTWRVLTMGSGPVLLMLHGTGASLHSWRGLAPLLAPHFTLVTPDLPGHGGTERPDSAGSTLPGMARSLAGLLAALDVTPALVVGHSAGAAILARMTLDGSIAPRSLISLNGAFVPFRGVASQFFSPLAKLLALNPLVPHLFAWRAGDPKVVDKLLAETGSKLDPAGVDAYARLAGNPDHVGGALAMMANWDLVPLEDALPRLPAHLVLVAAANDGTVPPDQAATLHRRVPGSTLIRLRGLGHLAHEEDPQAIALIVLDEARRTGLLPETPPA